MDDWFDDLEPAAHNASQASIKITQNNSQALQGYLDKGESKAILPCCMHASAP